MEASDREGTAVRIRNLNPKPTVFTGNPLMSARWKTIYRNGDGCFTVNSGNNAPYGLDADFNFAPTSFDIIANYDTGIPNADVAPWITGLPDGQVCFLCDVEPLLDINVMMEAHAQIDKNKNYNAHSGIVKASGVPGSRIVVSAVCRHQLDNRNCVTVRFASDAEPNTDVARVWGIAIVTGEEKEIMDLLDVGAFTALTAPYAAVPAGGGVFLLALVILTGGWPHEAREPIRRSELRADDSNMEFHHGPACHHAGRQALEIQLPPIWEPYSGENVRLSADRADACKRMEFRMGGALGDLALLAVRWSEGRGRIQGAAGYSRHQCAPRVRVHANRHVLHRVGRVADFAGGWRSYLHSRHRTLLNDGLGVAA